METVFAVPSPPREERFRNILKVFSIGPRLLIWLSYFASWVGHAGQKRESGERYLTHPVAVAVILIVKLRLREWRAVAEGLLHDIPEQSRVTAPLVAFFFGRTVARELQALTHHKNEPVEEYIARLLAAGARVLLVKLADRLHNLRTLHHCRPAKRQPKITETKRYYLPLCDALIQMLPATEQWRGEYLRREILKECAKYPDS